MEYERADISIVVSFFQLLVYYFEIAKKAETIRFL